MHAYAEEYLNDAMENLGEAFDYAANACGLTLDGFMELFLAGGYADSFGKGSPKVIAGLSGTELVMEVIAKSGKKIKFPEPRVVYDCSSEYWCGWILSYYQWASGRSFREIHRLFPMHEIEKLYPTHHEPTRLQRQRKLSGYSQKQLAEKSGVNLRTLQQYESGAKELAKASVTTVASLANVLGCQIEDIIS